MAEPPRVVLVDNRDSFTWNLVEEFACRRARVEVWRNDARAAEVLERAAGGRRGLLVLSPGPGSPREAGCCAELVGMAAREGVPLFGVCLGLQVIVEALGGRVSRARQAVHGWATSVEHGGDGIFEGLDSPISAGRYHSLAVVDLPPALEVTARSEGVVMAVRHRQAAILGVQFHPESILTPDGGAIIANLLEWARRVSG